MSEISPIIEPTQIRSSSDRPHAKYDYLIARAKRVPAAKTVVVHPCDETSLRGARQFYTDCCCQWVQTCFGRAAVARRPGFQFNLPSGTQAGVRNLAPKHVGRKETSCS